MSMTSLHDDLKPLPVFNICQFGSILTSYKTCLHDISYKIGSTRYNY